VKADKCPFDHGQSQSGTPPPPQDMMDNNAANNGRVVYMHGFAHTTTIADLERICSRSGSVEVCKIMTDPHTGQSRGYAFITMATNEEAGVLIEAVNGKMIEGYKYTARFSNRGGPRASTPGFYMGKQKYPLAPVSPPPMYPPPIPAAVPFYDPYTRTPAVRDPYARDPYARDVYARDPYGRDPYGRDPYGRDPYGRDPYGRDQYTRDPYAAADPYARDAYGGARHTRESTPGRDSYSRDSYSSTDRNGSQRAYSNQPPLSSAISIPQ